MLCPIPFLRNRSSSQFQQSSTTCTLLGEIKLELRDRYPGRESLDARPGEDEPIGRG